MDTIVPINFTQVMDLTAMGIQEKYCGFQSLTLESDRYLCVTEADQSGALQLSIVDFNDTQNINRRPIQAENAYMNPTSHIIALKASPTIQIYDLDRKVKLQETQMNDQIVFCKWISSKFLAIVTVSQVFHWELGGSDPVLVFDRSPDLNNHQIINYKTNSQMTWFCLVGISQHQGRIVGHMQLFSKDKNASQTREGHAVSFIEYQMNEGGPTQTLLCFATRTDTDSKLFISGLGGGSSSSSSTSSQTQYGSKSSDIINTSPSDFPVILEHSSKFQVLYMVTKLGFIHIFDVQTCTLLYKNKISQDQDTIFVATPVGGSKVEKSPSDGIICVDKRGKVFNISLNETSIIPYLISQGNLSPALGLASRSNLPGADDLFVKQFQKLFQEGRFQEAAVVAADSPRGILRTPQTINLYKSIQGHQPPPILQYFGVLLQRGKLNKYETLELAVPILQQKKMDLLEKWVDEDKLDYSDEFVDAIKDVDAKLALKIYLKVGNHEKIIQLLAEFGQYEKLMTYKKENNVNVDWMKIVTSVLGRDRKGAVKMAITVVKEESKSGIQGQGQPPSQPFPPSQHQLTQKFVDLFQSRHCLPETTEFLLDILSSNLPEDGSLQTQLLELNLVNAPQIAEEIFKNRLFSHYNRQRIAEGCEKAGLFHRALEHYPDITNRKRVIRHAHTMSPDFLIEFFGTLDDKDFIECLREMFSSNLSMNLNIGVQISVRYVNKKVKLNDLIQLYEEFKSYEGLVSFLNPILPLVDDKDAHFKFIEAASKLGRFSDVERVCKESNHYDPERVRDFLKDIKLSDPVPLMIVCDRFGFIADLTKYLNKNSMRRAIEIYVTQFNPDNTPLVIGSLLDDDTSEEYIKGLLNNVGSLCPIGPLVEEVEKRNRLKIIHPWLEARLREGNTDTHLHNAIAKIMIDTRQEPEKFLTNNKYYDHQVVGKYCESKDPNLSLLAYQQGNAEGKYDHDIVRVAYSSSLYKQMAIFLIERMDIALWKHVLNEPDYEEHRRDIIDHVQISLKESQVPEQVTTAVKAFMNSQLQNELVGLLETIIIDGNNRAFSENTNLQNLLILTSIRAVGGDIDDDDSLTDDDRERIMKEKQSSPHRHKVMDYIKKLSHYNASEIASIATKNGLYEEGFVAYTKVNMNVQAISILIDQINDLDRANDFAIKVDEKDVYSRLGKAQLDNGMIKESIESFLKASDPQYYHEVISLCQSQSLYEPLVKYLSMCRQIILESKIDSELIYSYAKLDNLNKVDEIVQSSQLANINDVGERLYDEGHYEAAKILFTYDNAFSKLALTLVKLGEYQEAVDMARKSNKISTWKEVGKACIESGEYMLARTCGLNVIVDRDELIELIRFYENRGLHEHLIILIEDGLSSESSHPGMYTELAILYSKYAPSKLMSHIKQNHHHLNISKVSSSFEKNMNWKALTHLYAQDQSYDKAVETMMDHPEAFDQQQFMYAVTRAQTTEICYKSVKFFMDNHPLLLNDLLLAIVNRVDARRIINTVGDKFKPFIKVYLKKIQEINDDIVNDTINNIYIEEDDYESLRSSIDRFDKFDALELAKVLENHDLIEFRRIASDLYRQKGKHEKAVSLLKKDALFDDSIKAASISNDVNVVKDLMVYFLEEGNHHAFAACLYQCYDIVKPDVVLELAWKYKQIDFAFPYIIQFVKETVDKVESLEKEVLKRNDKQTGGGIPTHHLSGGGIPTHHLSGGGIPTHHLSGGGSVIPHHHMTTGGQQMIPPHHMTTGNVLPVQGDYPLPQQQQQGLYHSNPNPFMGGNQNFINPPNVQQQQKYTMSNDPSMYKR